MLHPFSPGIMEPNESELRRLIYLLPKTASALDEVSGEREYVWVLLVSHSYSFTYLLGYNVVCFVLGLTVIYPIFGTRATWSIVTFMSSVPWFTIFLVRREINS